MKTIVVNLFGGPGVGKSTLAAELFVLFKKNGVSCEMLQEYVKGWAWEGKKVGPFDQVYILAKQLKLESRLYGKVDVVITDSPLLFSPIYERLYQNMAASEPMAMTILQTAKEHGVEHVNFLLKREFKYQAEGRYETEEMARKVDNWMETFLAFHQIPYTLVAGPTRSDDIYKQVWRRVKAPKQLPLITARFEASSTDLVLSRTDIPLQ